VRPAVDKDRYGFAIDSGELATARLTAAQLQARDAARGDDMDRRDMARVGKWSDMLDAGLEGYAAAFPSKLRRRARRGVPGPLRGLVWLKLTGAQALIEGQDLGPLPASLWALALGMAPGAGPTLAVAAAGADRADADSGAPAAAATTAAGPAAAAAATAGDSVLAHSSALSHLSVVLPVVSAARAAVLGAAPAVAAGDIAARARARALQQQQQPGGTAAAADPAFALPSPQPAAAAAVAAAAAAAAAAATASSGGFAGSVVPPPSVASAAEYDAWLSEARATLLRQRDCFAAPTAAAAAAAPATAGVPYGPAPPPPLTLSTGPKNGYSPGNPEALGAAASAAVAANAASAASAAAAAAAATAARTADGAAANAAAAAASEGAASARPRSHWPHSSTVTATVGALSASGSPSGGIGSGPVPPGILLYSALASLPCPEWADRIMRDLHRTLPRAVQFRERAGAGQRALGNVLRAYTLWDPQVGYCQGT
jgi:hypothetical protein